MYFYCIYYYLNRRSVSTPDEIENEFFPWWQRGTDGAACLVSVGGTSREDE